MRLLTILALAATLAGCTATATTASPRPSTPSSPPAFPSPVPRSIQCDGQEPVGAIGAADWAQTRDDVALGPMRWPNLKAMATGDPHNWGYRDAAGFHFKTGVELTAGATVTVTVAPEARGQAGLEDGVRYGYSPAQAVTFHACPHSATAYVGGFFVKRLSCVPLDIQVGNARPVRIVVSFFAGRCR